MKKKQLSEFIIAAANFPFPHDGTGGWEADRTAEAEFVRQIRDSKEITLADQRTALDFLCLTLRRMANNVRDKLSGNSRQYRNHAAGLIAACPSVSLKVEVQTELFAWDDGLTTFERLGLLAAKVMATSVRALPEVEGDERYEEKAWLRDAWRGSATLDEIRAAYNTQYERDIGSDRGMHHVIEGAFKAVGEAMPQRKRGRRPKSPK